jgi:transcription factor IIIB subunit 2
VSFERIVDDTLEYLYKELKVDEEYDEAFTKARKILLLAQTYKRVNKEKWQHLHIYVGAALYFGFRSKQAPYLLIDISDKLKECSVIKLARCYLKLLEFVRTDLDSSNPNSQERNELSQGL